MFKLKRVYFRQFICCSLYLNSLALLWYPQICLSQSLAELEQGFAIASGAKRLQMALSLADELKRSDADRAIAYATEARQLLKPKSQPEIHLKLLNIFASAYLQKADFDRSHTYCMRALKFAEASSQADSLEAAKTHNVLGAAAWFQGELRKAEDYFKRALDIRLAKQALQGLGGIYNNLGILREAQGHYNIATDNYLLAINYASKTEDSSVLARAYSNLGVINHRLKNYDIALTYYHQALQLKLKLGDLPGAALIYNNIGESLRNNQQFFDAIDALLKGIALLAESNSPGDMHRLQLFTNLASAYVDIDNFAEAKKYFNKSQQLNNKLDVPHIRMQWLEGMAKERFKNNDLPGALPYAEEFFAAATTLEDFSGIKNAYYLFYQIYKQDNKPLLALSNLEAYEAVKDRLFREENSQYIANLQEEFQREKREKDLALLRQQNTTQQLDLKRQQAIRNASILLSILFSLLVIFFVWLRKSRLATELLEEKVAQRTGEITKKNQVISSLLKQKEALLQHKNHLFTMVSHEFKTPLTLIIGEMERLVEKVRSKDARVSLQKNQYHAGQLLRMVNQLLDLARLEERVDSAETRVLDFNGVLQHLLANLETIFSEHTLQVELALQQPLWVSASSDGLEKIIVNLLTNAVKYTPARGQITLRTYSKERLVYFEVEDSGIGIAPKDQQHVFERFARVESSATQNIPGAGMGLALVKALVESFGGAISLRSDIDLGTTFILCLPQVKYPETQSTDSQNAFETDDVSPFCQQEITLASGFAQASHPVERGEDLANQAAKPVILVVEDNLDMRLFIEQSLQRNFYCLLAENGKAGIAMAVQEVPDLIITDLMMPEADGYQLAEVVRSAEMTSHIPIIMLTAKGDQQSKLTAWRSNIDEFIEKPFSVSELNQRCANLLRIRELLRAYLYRGVAASEPLQVPTSFDISPRDAKFLQGLQHFLEQHFQDSEIGAKQISSALAITEKQLQRKVKALTDQTIPSYVRNFRLQRGAELLKSGKSLAEIALDVGFASQSYFSTAFAARYGSSPSQYREALKKHHGE